MVHFSTLKAFLTVADMKSFSRAAEHLHATQPAVSLQVKKLETFYHAKLFQRRGRWTELTEEGVIAKTYAERLLRLLKESEHQVEHMALTGSKWVRIGAGYTSGPYVLASLLGTFKRLHPKLEVTMKTGKFDELVNMLAGDEIDFCLSRLPRSVEPYGFKHEPYKKIIMKPVASCDNPISKKRNLSLSRFAQEPFILQPKGRLNRDVVELFFLQKNIPIKVLMEFDSIEAIKTAVKENFGVSVINEYSLVADLIAKTLKVLSIREFEINLPLSIVYRGEKKLSTAGQQLLDFLRQKKKDEY